MIRAEPFTEYARDDRASEVNVGVDVRRMAPFGLPPTLFGTFTENIWDAVYGGVWAQILHNPSFEPDHFSAQNVMDAMRYGRLVTDPSFGSGYVRVEPLVEEADRPGRFARSSALGLPLPWEELRPAGMRYEPRDGDAANSERALMVMGLPKREVGVRQGVYLPAHRVLTYRGSLWTKRVGASAALTISLRRRDRPDEIIARVVLSVSKAVWQRHEFTLEVAKNAIARLEKLDFCLSLADEERVLIDNVLLWPADHIEGFDPEVIQAARALKTPLLRFGGNFMSGYHWQDGVGALERRRTLLNQAWGLPEYNHFGTNEFIRLCRLIGAEPQISVNAGSGDASEAAAWVEYCNGAPSTKYGALRARHGHRAPYNVKYWEVGNELWGDFQIGWQTPEGNARRYLSFARAIKRVDPTVRLIATGADIDFYEKWNQELINRAGDALDLISTHLVIGMQPGEQRRPGADDAFTRAADLAVPVGVGRKLDEMREQIERGRPGAKLAFTEWQFWSLRPEDPRFTNLGGAVNSAAFFNMLARRADFVPLSNMSNLVHFAGIHRQRGTLFVTPSYHVLQLYAEVAHYRPLAIRVRTPMYDVRDGNRRVPQIPDVPYVDALALVSPRGDEVRFYLVNRHTRAEIPAVINTAGFPASGESTLRVITHDRLDAANTPENPALIAISTTTIKNNNRSQLRLTLPPHSISVVTMRRDARASN